MGAAAVFETTAATPLSAKFSMKLNLAFSFYRKLQKTTFSFWF